jgi:hypothetical protein
VLSPRCVRITEAASLAASVWCSSNRSAQAFHLPREKPSPPSQRSVFLLKPLVHASPKKSLWTSKNLKPAYMTHCAAVTVSVSSNCLAVTMAFVGKFLVRVSGFVSNASLKSKKPEMPICRIAISSPCCTNLAEKFVK